jgi:hypothetical protein
MRDVVSAQLFPDHISITQFRKNHVTAMEYYFPKILMMCAEAWLVKFIWAPLDETKFKTNAARDRTPKSPLENILGWLSKVEKTDREEEQPHQVDRNRYPPGLDQREERQTVIRECCHDLDVKEVKREEEKK